MKRVRCSLYRKEMRRKIKKKERESKSFAQRDALSVHLNIIFYFNFFF